MLTLDSAEEIALPVARVFDEITDFERLERGVARRGAEVRRVDDLAGPCVGMTWQARMSLRGRVRDLTVQLTEHAPPEALLVTAESSGIAAELRVVLTRLAPARTRMAVTLEVAPRSLKGRVLLQSVRLAGGTLEARFHRQVADYALDMEDRTARRR